MDSVAHHIRRCGPFLRRQDLLAAGYDDAHIKQALARRQIFRVRQGWYARPDTPEVAVRAVRVGGRVTGVSALRLMGLFLPRPPRAEVVVPANAARLRSPRIRSERLSALDGVATSWRDSPRSELNPSSWIVSADEALLHVLRSEGRDLAVAACDGALRYLGWNLGRLQAAFAAAPARTRTWARLVDGRSDSWGETFLRLWLRDAGIPMEPQPKVDGVGRLDGRVSPRVYLEVDGGQHDEDWVGVGGSSFESDHRRDVLMALRGHRVLRFTNRQLVEEWPSCLEAIRTARDDDLRVPRGIVLERVHLRSRP